MQRKESKTKRPNAGSVFESAAPQLPEGLTQPSVESSGKAGGEKSSWHEVLEGVKDKIAEGNLW